MTAKEGKNSNWVAFGRKFRGKGLIQVWNSPWEVSSETHRLGGPLTGSFEGEINVLGWLETAETSKMAVGNSDKDVACIHFKSSLPMKGIGHKHSL